MDLPAIYRTPSEQQALDDELPKSRAELLMRRDLSWSDFLKSYAKIDAAENAQRKARRFKPAIVAFEKVPEGGISAGSGRQDQAPQVAQSGPAPRGLPAGPTLAAQIKLAEETIIGLLQQAGSGTGLFAHREAGNLSTLLTGINE